ncbi:hypothetical protein [Spirilliplanes yamanashiensis]|uniref:Glycosyltransferase n=1 Tax=Spirilliplanes yamanashiensis TaxID=42233 RepID=A0A8J4DLQ8_9ACTN|nr:hypothetical protein [Spirilliplanes yamanashiensis]MDP9816116.1 hypothetical protein [Spirilliplanes yamanashiensis]GIJ05638.1 hypothetical protein Sya03_49900 [Spirilliplanes yamanashiensis]
MTDLAVVVPSRNRPDHARDLAAEFADTCAAKTVLVFAVDDSDPRAADYGVALDVEPAAASEATDAYWAEVAERGVGVLRTASSTPEEALNRGVAAVLDGLGPWAVGYLGDDHRPRTPGWDRRFLDELHALDGGLVFAEDLVEGAALPTQIAVTADVARELGFLVPPGVCLPYAGTFWRDLGTAAGCLRYVGDVVVERLTAASHEHVDEAGRHDPSRVAYRAYAEGQLLADVERVRKLTRGVSGVAAQ